MSAQVLEASAKISSEVRAKASYKSLRARQEAAMLQDIESALTELQSKR